MVMETLTEKNHIFKFTLLKSKLKGTPYTTNDSNKSNFF